MEKNRETGRKKGVSEFSEREKRARRKKWREAKCLARAKESASALLQSDTPPNSPTGAESPESQLELGPSRLDHWKYK